MGGRPFDDTVVDLAVACELVHTATLLHDDVLDQGEERRGVTTARLVYGNAASVLGGDHLLVEAMQRVRRSGFIDLLGSLMDTLSEMISAEAIQLAHRGGFEPDKQVYMRIVRGKTASLFRWALESGATAGGLSSEACVNVMNMGESLGIAFQLVDDVLDLDGDPHVTGKDAWVDLSEGKFTWPLIVATEADPDLVGFLKEVAENPSMMEDATLARALRSRIVATGALEVTRTLALSYAEAARESLRKLPDHRVVQALEAVIDGCIHRIR